MVMNDQPAKNAKKRDLCKRNFHFQGGDQKRKNSEIVFH